MGKVILFGEPMVLFIAQEYGSLKDVSLFSKKVAGAELNVCIGLSRLGHKAVYITKLGATDSFGQYVYDELNKEGVDTSYIKFDKENNTGFMLKNRVKIGDPEIAYYRKNSAASKITIDEINNISFENVNLIHITGIACGISDNSLQFTYKLIEKAKEHHIDISFDPNIRQSLWKSRDIMVETLNKIAEQCDIFMPGIEEAKILTGLNDINKIADFYLNKGIKNIVIKLGSEGAYYKNKKHSGIIEGLKVEKVIDTVGAGDGFAVGVISGHLENLSLKDAVKRGNVIGSLQVQVEGDNEGLPNRKQLIELVK